MAAVPYSTLRVESRAVYSPYNRKALEDHIERMIALLDQIDGDCDSEDADPDIGIDDVPHDGDLAWGTL